MIDGVFDQALAVSPREVLDVLRLGIKVYGGSSMGALRAAELWTLGMTGIGRVFELYREEIVTAEDEVAILFDADSETCLTEPLVNVRCALERAVADGLIADALASRILAAAIALPYARRTYREIARAVACDEGASIDALIPRLRAHDQKKADALSLIQRVSRDLAALSASPCPCDRDDGRTGGAD
ncbi:MAG: TfuA-related McrA-glycine thioamidation protein [Polyangiaceae bacterium]|nr:TfuA-related McrA-glycine thioamidation protein [Polyangiaceae bacterium]